MKIRMFRHENAWWVSFEGSMPLPFKHLDTVIDHLQRKYPDAEIVMPEPTRCQCSEGWLKPETPLGAQNLGQMHRNPGFD
jgi:hypothetical protein